MGKTYFVEDLETATRAVGELQAAYDLALKELGAADKAEMTSKIALKIAEINAVHKQLHDSLLDD